MKIIITALISFVTMISCAQQNKPYPVSVATAAKPGAKESVASFSEGCFWHAEIIFQSLSGVRDAVSGYAGGTAKSPSYEDVASGRTGHAETVQIYYDSSKISFATLVDAFFASHDPTSLNRQGNDMGTEYRSIAFYRNEKEKQIIQDAIKKITDAKQYRNKIVTQVIPLNNFYTAETYHQEYISHNPGNGYVQNVSLPDYYDFRKTYKGKFKP
ncbi:MAG: peptide-methionine (S)-S-oxide reductase MsrA [Ferruginibacter sp.]